MKYGNEIKKTSDKIPKAPVGMLYENLTFMKAS